MLLSHRQLNASGQPTHRIADSRRLSEFTTPILKPCKQKGAAKQDSLLFDEGNGISTQKQQYDHTAIINVVRHEVNKWRELTEPSAWSVMVETVTIIQHWRHHT